ncbi:MAG: hypothetical protein WCT40_01900 [Candidatus Magasanikbacteria bacterium]|jgi:hypothetical protein
MVRKIASAVVICLAFVLIPCSSVCAVAGSAPTGAASAKSGLYGLNETAPKAGYDTGVTLIPKLNQVVGIGLGLIALVFFAMALYAGVRWLTARGKSELSEKALQALEAAIIGMAIVAASYAIAIFVINKLYPGTTTPGGATSPSGDSGCCTGIATGSGADAKTYCRTQYFGSEVWPKIKSDCDLYQGVWVGKDPNLVGDCTIFSGMAEESCRKSGGNFVQQDCSTIPGCMVQ